MPQPLLVRAPTHQDVQYGDALLVDLHSASNLASPHSGCGFVFAMFVPTSLLCSARARLCVQNPPLK
jgi:hypothetical protein